MVAHKQEKWDWNKEHAWHEVSGTIGSWANVGYKACTLKTWGTRAHKAGDKCSREKEHVKHEACEVSEHVG